MHQVIVKSGKRKIKVHSEKFFRLARLAKIANISSSLKNFTPFHRKSNQHSHLSLLFLNQGLSSKEQNLLRSYLKLLGIHLTHFPCNYLSGSFLRTSQSPSIKSSLHGNILCMHALTSQQEAQDSIYLFYQAIQDTIALSSGSLDFYEKSLFSSSVKLASQESINTLKWVWPWDRLAQNALSEPVQQKDRLKTWLYSEDKSIKLLDILTHLKNSKLIFAGLLRHTQAYYLVYDNLDRMLASKSLTQLTKLQARAQSSFEPCFISNRSYLLYF